MMPRPTLFFPGIVSPKPRARQRSSNPDNDCTGWTPNPRGAGYFFGLDEARRFKEANGVRMIVRSHELVNKGWAIAGKKDVITVFSSIDYRNTGNDGAALGAALLARAFPTA